MRPVGHTCGEPNEIELTAAHVLFYRSLSGLTRKEVDALFDHVCAGQPAALVTTAKVRVPGRSVPPRWGSIRFRLALRTYNPPPWGVRVVSLTKSRKIPTRKMLPLFFVTTAKDCAELEGAGLHSSHAYPVVHVDYEGRSHLSIRNPHNRLSTF